MVKRRCMEVEKEEEEEEWSGRVDGGFVSFL